MKKELAESEPKAYLSVVFNGADRKKFDLPRFVTSTKEQRAHGLPVHLICVLQHAQENQLRLLSMTDSHATGSNHIVEAFHRTINEIERTSSLPQKLFFPPDN